MTGDAFKKARPGDPLVIPARAYNAFIDTAQAFAAVQSRTGGRPPAVAARSSGIVTVKNNTAGNLDRFAVLGVDDVIISPADNESEFLSRVGLVGVTPTVTDHKGKFLILLEPLAAGAMGSAYATGVCPVKVDVSNEDDDQAADIADGISANLKAGSGGSAAILWRAGGTGVQWAVVRLGGGGSDSKLTPVRVFKAGGDTGDASAKCSYTYTVRSMHGAEIPGIPDTQVIAVMQQRSYGFMNPGNIGLLIKLDIATAIAFGLINGSSSGGTDGLIPALFWVDETPGTYICNTINPPDSSSGAS